MKTARVLAAMCALALVGATTPARAQAPDPEAAVRRATAQRMPIGATLKLKMRDGQRLKAVLFAVDDEGILVKPSTRIPVPAVRIAFDRLDQIERDKGRLNFGRYVGIGAAVGGGALLAVFLSFAAG